MPASPPPRSAVGVAVVGASAGGVETLRALAAALPPELPCPVVVVLHVAEEGGSILAHILDRAGPLPASAVVDGSPLTPGHLLVAPPAHHVLFEGERLRLAKHVPDAPRRRPSIDVTMRSAAAAFGPRAVGVVLTGTLRDGTAGLAAIQAAGGRVLVQDPEEALRPEMPRSALARLQPDAVLPIAALARWLWAAAAAPVDAPRGTPAPGGL